MDSLHDTVRQALEDAVGVGVHATLEPLDGGDHVLPPTYVVDDAGASKHNLSRPDEHGHSRWVSIDSPASFANRVERRLVEAELGLDPLRVSVAGQTLSTMQLPHRAFDAIIRDSEKDGTAFRQSEVGQALVDASPADARALLQHDPAMLLLGGWDSTGLGAAKGRERKWAAALSVEISGRGARTVGRAGGRLDPLGITGDAGKVEIDKKASTYTLQPLEPDKTEKGAAKAGAGKTKAPDAKRLSEVNHGNIAPTISAKGVLVDGIDLRGSLSFARLRRYRFGNDEASLDARTLIACMGLYGVAAELELGLDLRRDCELVATQVQWSLRRAGGSESLDVTRERALEALKTALDAVPLAKPVVFKGTATLEELVARSR